jgi:hypothetical protein
MASEEAGDTVTRKTQNVKGETYEGKKMTGQPVRLFHIVQLTSHVSRLTEAL